MPILGSFMKFEPMRTLAYSSITTSYVSVGTATFPAIHQMIVTNATNQILTFSWDTENDHFVLLPNTQFVSDINANKSTNHLFLGANENLYVKYAGTEPSSGAVYFSTMYGTTKGTPNTI